MSTARYEADTEMIFTQCIYVQYYQGHINFIKSLHIRNFFRNWGITFLALTLFKSLGEGEGEVAVLA